MNLPFEYDQVALGEFGGTTPTTTDFENARVVILPIPLDRTTSYVAGTRNGPHEILVASSHMELWDEETGTDVHSIGIFTLPEMEFPFAAMEDVVREIEGFVARGGRLVITFFPETAKPFGFFFPGQIGSPGPARKTTKTGKKSQPAKADKKKKKPADEVEGMLRRTSLKERWGVEFGFAPLQAGEGASYKSAEVVNETALPLPDILEWHSATTFTNLDKSWQTIYARGTNAVVAFQRFE